MIQPTRLTWLSRRDNPAGSWVVYWMQHSQRLDHNHALAFAFDQARKLHLPLMVYFGLADAYPGATLRAYHFMLHGLAHTARRLTSQGVPFVLRREDPGKGAAALGAHARLLVCDRGYTRLEQRWRQDAAAGAACPVVVVESDAVVPADEVSQRQEWAARTIRPKIMRLLPDYLVPLAPRPLEAAATTRTPPLEGLPPDPQMLLDRLPLRLTPPCPGITPGEEAGQAVLAGFVEHRLATYHRDRNDPTLHGQSGLSPYLHFGQVSPLAAALAAHARPGPGADAFLEELVVRRELAVNYCLHNPEYDRYDGLPDWARQNLARHARDIREYRYRPGELEQARTHDPAWNAAQRQLLVAGKMHGYLRMYWGKKVLQWMDDPREAFSTLVALNDAYSLDGRDPNGYAGVAWCFGLHDRPWARRPILGTVRYMNYAGLARKFDLNTYLAAWGDMPLPPGERLFSE